MTYALRDDWKHVGTFKVWMDYKTYSEDEDGELFTVTTTEQAVRAYADSRFNVMGHPYD